MDNILKELKGLSWRTLSSGTLTVHGVLELNPAKKNMIEKWYTREDDRKQSAVKFWVWNHPYSSWRLLVTLLDRVGKRDVADKLRHYVEKLTGMLSSYL